MIPKRIITTWICDPARDRYTERHRAMFATCINSWLRLMPDYEIVLVTHGSLETMQDDWLKARLDEGNFIGASQWARLRLLFTFGGIFLDADVEAVRRFDSLLDGPFTCGHLGNDQHFANNAIMAAPPRHQFVAEMFRRLMQTDTSHSDFGNLSGPFLITSLLANYGWRGEDVDSMVQTAGGPVAIRRSAVFHPYDWNESFDREKHILDDTLAVHHWASSWKPVDQQPQHEWTGVRA